MSPLPRIIRLYTADGTLLAEESAKSNAKRFSVRAHADQRQLDELISRHPSAARATITNWAFRIVDGRSQSVGVI